MVVYLINALFALLLFLRKLYADSNCQGPNFGAALDRICKQVNVEIVKRSDAGKFIGLPKREFAERAIAWLKHCRRLRMCKP